MIILKNDMDNEVLKLSIKKDESIIPEIASFISSTANKLGLSKRKSFYLCFVLETALELRMNEIEDEESLITVSAIDNGKYFKFSLTDFGKPYILTKNQQEILKRKIVDRFSFEQNGRKGQCLSFLYYYDGKEKEDIIIEKEELLDENFIIRKLNNDEEDILSAIKCLYESYGYEYYHQNLYSVDSFKKYIKSGRYIPIIAENDHKQKMCYCALDENIWFEGVPELSNLVTNPIARGKGLASKIFKKTEDIAIEEGYEGVHVSAVAYHPYTQKMCNKLGYTPSAIEYSINPKGTDGIETRSDCVIGIKVFNKTKKHELYINQECNEVITTIFDHEKLNYEIHNQSTNDNQASEMTYVIDTDTSNCFVKLDICGNNFNKEISELLDKDEIKELDVITINLNTNNPSAIDGYNALKELGFICGGMIMGPKNGDYMLLQKFKEEPDYERIVLEDNYKELKNLLNKINLV